MAVSVTWTKQPLVMVGVVTQAPKVVVNGVNATPTSAKVFFDVAGRLWAVHLWGTDDFGVPIGWDYQYRNGAWATDIPNYVQVAADQAVALYRAP